MKHALHVVGRDSAKRIFPLVGLDDRGKIILRKRWMRGEVMACMAKRPRVTVGMAAWGGSHDWARQWREPGHEVPLMAPQSVKPSVKTNKNALREAEASAEAVTRPSRRFVPIQEVEHQEVQALHRVRERLMGARTALVHARRGRWAESGIVVPQGVNAFRTVVLEKLEAAPAQLTSLRQELFSKLCDALGQGAAALAYDADTLAAMAPRHPAGHRLLTIPGIGPIPASALLAAVSEVGVVTHGRPFSAWLGWVPQPHSTGGQTRL